MRHAHLALLQWTREVDLFDLLAQVGRLVDQGDQAVFDGQGDGGAFFDVLAKGS